MFNDLLGSGTLLLVIGAVLAYFRNVPMHLYNLIERVFVIRVEIQEEDESFQWLKIWLAKQLNNTLSVAVFTRRPGAAPEWEDANDAFKYDENAVDKKRPIVVFTPAPGWYWFFYEGKLVTISKVRSEGSETMKVRESLTMRVFSWDLTIARRLVEEARDFALPKDGKVEIRSCGSGGYWSLTGRIRPRPIESVILKDNLAQELLQDVRRFQESVNWYTSLGVPYRRGYLLYGPAGTGKTSVVLAVASELGMNVNVLSLSAPGMNDSKLVELLSSTDVNTIILIEDIDCAFSKRQPGTDRKKQLDFGLTFSGVLNALDGIMSQDGRIVFMTTNHPEKLDPALTRPGRADVKVKIGNASRDQIFRIFKRFFPDSELATEFANRLPDDEISMAKIQHHLTMYRNDPRAAVDNWNEVLKESTYDHTSKFVESKESQASS